jgi:hypothetical protein
MHRVRLGKEMMVEATARVRRREGRGLSLGLCGNCEVNAAERGERAIAWKCVLCLDPVVASLSAMSAIPAVE